MMGSGNTVVADTVVHDSTAYGWDEMVYDKAASRSYGTAAANWAWSTASIM